MTSVFAKRRMVAFRFVLCTLLLLLVALLCGACTEYERQGYNPKPVNGPAYWETHPFGDQTFQN